MKRIIVRIVLGIIGVIVVAVLAGVVWIYGLHPKKRPAPELVAPTDRQSIERGEYLATSLLACVSCHSDVDLTEPLEKVDRTALFAGRDFSKDMGPDFPGRIVAPNLTPSKAQGIGTWTDGEIVRALRDGIGHGDRPLFTLMPYESFGTTLTDQDALAVVAYLRSLAPSEKELPKTQIAFPVSALTRLMPVISSPPTTVPSPRAGDAYGDYLLRAASCSFCHGTFDEMHHAAPGHEYAGGDVNKENGETFFTPNITSDPATGIGAYSEDDVVRALEGTGKSGRKLRAMPTGAFRRLTDEDKHAIARAVKRLPPVSHVPGMP